MENAVSPETQEVIPGSDDYNALMAEKFDDAQKVVEEGAQRPDWLPEKFATPEDLAKAYAELERKQSQKAPASQPTETSDIEGARQVVEQAGVDFEALSAEFAASGALSDQSYAMLEAKGFPRELVDDFIDGQAAKAQLYRTEALTPIGGEEAFADMVQWAATGGLTTEEIMAFNNQVESGNLAAAKMAILGLKARFDAANGTEPTLLNGNAPASGDVFRSTAELTAAMKDPRYKKDPAYREDVRQKLARSNIY